MKKLNFCIYSAQYLPNLGGVERYTYNLAKKLLEKGHAVTVVTTNTASLPARETVEGIEIFRMPCWDALHGRYPITKCNLEHRRMTQELAEHNFDLVIVQTRFYVHSLCGVQFAHKHNIPSIVIEHGTAHLSVGNSVLDFLGQLYEHAITLPVRRLADGFYGVSQDCCQWSAHFGIQSKGTLYNAVDIEDICEKYNAPVEDYRQQCHSENAIVITFTGRLLKEKGILKLVDAVKQLNDRGCPVELFIAGDGDLLQTLQAEDTPEIHVLGRIDFAHVVALLKDSDIFCLPSDSEGFPTSVLEAVACQCYVITTKQGGAKELITDASLGTILQENSVSCIAEAIQTVAEDSDYRISATQNAYRKMCDCFTWDRTAERVVEIQQELSKA